MQQLGSGNVGTGNKVRWVRFDDGKEPGGWCCSFDQVLAFRCVTGGNEGKKNGRRFLGCFEALALLSFPLAVWGRIGIGLLPPPQTVFPSAQDSSEA